MLKPYNIPNIFPANTVLNANKITSPIQLYNAINFSIQIVFSGTPTGTFKLQSSCDPAAAATATGLYTGINEPTHWTDVANSTFTVSAAGDVQWNYRDPGFNWIRVVYTDASGGASTATISSATFNGKGV